MSALFNNPDILETRNKLWITALKRLRLCKSVFLAVGGDQHILDLYCVQEEEAARFKMSRFMSNVFRPLSLQINKVNYCKGAKQHHL